MEDAISITTRRRTTIEGTLQLAFPYDPLRRQTRLICYEQRPPLKVIRAFPLPAGGALVHLHNMSGGVLSGDQLSTSIEVGEHAYAQLTSTSATRIYRSRPSTETARQTTSIRVAENGLLEYVPDPLIPFAGARYIQHTSIELAPGAGLFWWETVAPGRMARGELFDYASLRIENEIRTYDAPLAIERLHLQPAAEHRQTQFASPAHMGPYHYFCSFYICKVGLDAPGWTHLEHELQTIAQHHTHTGESYWGVSTLVAHGLVIRALSKHGSDLNAALLDFWQTAKRMLYGQDAIPPRKIY